jgi:hypothetical protein
VRKGLLGPENFEKAELPLTFIATNDHILEGGKKW